jgi:hypothetical protein
VLVAHKASSEIKLRSQRIAAEFALLRLREFREGFQNVGSCCAVVFVD